MRRLLAALALGSALAWLPAAAMAEEQAIEPSFDCGKATTAVERTICADPALSVLDLAMSDAYEAARSAPGVDRAALARGQAAWLSQDLRKCGEATFGETPA